MGPQPSRRHRLHLRSPRHLVGAANHVWSAPEEQQPSRARRGQGCRRQGHPWVRASRVRGSPEQLGGHDPVVCGGALRKVDGGGCGRDEQYGSCVVGGSVRIHTGVHSDQEQHEGVLPNFRLHDRHGLFRAPHVAGRSEGLINSPREGRLP